MNALVERWRCPHCSETYDERYDARECARSHARAFDSQQPRKVEVRETETIEMSLAEFDSDQPDLSALTDAEREIVEAVLLGDSGVRKFAEKQGWSSPGTASKLIARACERVPELEEYRASGGRR